MHGIKPVTRLVVHNRFLLHQIRRQSTYVRTFRSDDVVLLRPAKDLAHEGHLSTLKVGRSVQLHNGVIKAADIIGKTERQIVQTSKGIEYRVFEPSLAEYVCLTKRLVTPLYPSSTNIIVSLLDLHPPYENDTVEILEAGTGHGSLTLYLAQAIHNFNKALPFQSPPGNRATEIQVKDQDEATERKASRNAIIHTVDISAKHSEHAKKVVQGFRRGVYAGDVDFHLGDLPEFFAKQGSGKGRYLSHVILDMPSPEDRLGLVCEHLKDDGKLLVFNPSVTQIIDCIERIVIDGTPLYLERIVEMAGSFAGGREWDVRIAKIKNPQKELLKKNSKESTEANSVGFIGRILKILSRWLSNDSDLATTSSTIRNYAYVCRPKAGDRIPVGGFVGVWRRKRDDE